MKIEVKRGFDVAIEMDVEFHEEDLQTNVAISVACEKMAYAVEQAIKKNIADELEALSTDYDAELTGVGFQRDSTKVEVKHFE